MFEKWGKQLDFGSLGLNTLTPERSEPSNERKKGVLFQTLLSLGKIVQLIFSPLHGFFLISVTDNSFTGLCVTQRVS